MTAPLHPRLAELRTELNRTRDALLSAVARVPAEAAQIRVEASVLASLDRYGLNRPGPRTKAPGPVSPTGRVTLAEGLGGLAESRRRILELVHRVSGRALEQLTAPHPLVGELNFYQWLLVLGQHEERHTIQIRETARRLADQAPAAGY